MRRFVLIILVLLAAAAALAQETPKPAARNDFSWARSPYRLDFTIKELDDGKVINSRSYSMVMQSAEERGRSYGSVKAGSKVPIITTNKEGQPTTTYMDVGVEINSQLYVLENGNLLLGANAELNSLASTQTMTNPILRGFHSNTTSEISAGKPAQIALVDDPVSNHRFQIEVTATKLR